MILNSPQTEMGAQPVAVSAEGVSKSYGRGASITNVLNNVDLVVRRRQCVFLAGPSGSGKTTLLSILGCIPSSSATSFALA